MSRRAISQSKPLNQKESLPWQSEKAENSSTMIPPIDKSKSTNTTNVVISNDSIQDWIAPFHPQLSAVQIEQVQKYISLLLLWNQKISLTSIENPQELVSRHFGESFFGTKFIENVGCRLADVGSGAGFPGLALKIVLPDLQVFLIEQDTRKSTFLNEAIRALNLADAKVLRSPYEALAPEISKFDAIVARAVGDHKSLLKWAAPRLNESGQAILWIGAEDAARLSDLSTWKWRLPLALPNSKNRVLLSGVPAR
jgi:16S rRNA (guanine527-N7)-methyltransferase